MPECTCHFDVKSCPIHTQADFDAQTSKVTILIERTTAEEFLSWITEENVKHLTAIQLELYTAMKEAVDA